MPPCARPISPWSEVGSRACRRAGLLRFERVEEVDEVAVRRLHQVAVEVDVVALLLVRVERGRCASNSAQELPLAALGLVEGPRRRSRGSRSRRSATSRHSRPCVVLRIHQHVVRVDERHDEEERLLLAPPAESQVLQHALVAGAARRRPRSCSGRRCRWCRRLPRAMSWLAPASCGFQRAKPYFADVGRRQVVAGGLADVQLALVDDVVAGGQPSPCARFLKLRRQLDLRVLGVPACPPRACT